uniref:Uncharacterized protein n=1 Tax=Ciona savignyi TaxID=51511 RepID=H2ZCQ9_CIOSA
MRTGARRFSFEEPPNRGYVPSVNSPLIAAKENLGNINPCKSPTDENETTPPDGKLCNSDEIKETPARMMCVRERGYDSMSGSITSVRDLLSPLQQSRNRSLKLDTPENRRSALRLNRRIHQKCDDAVSYLSPTCLTGSFKAISSVSYESSASSIGRSITNITEAESDRKSVDLNGDEVFEEKDADQIICRKQRRHSSEDDNRRMSVDDPRGGIRFSSNSQPMVPVVARYPYQPIKRRKVQ